MRSSSHLLRAVLATSLMLAVTACHGAASPSPSVVAEPTPTPPPPTEEEVIQAFLLVAGNTALTMHVVADGKETVTAGRTTDTVKIGFDMDLSGQNGVGTAVVDTDPSTVPVSLLVVENRAYVEDNGTWTEVPDYRPSTPLNPFGGLTTLDSLSYRGHQIVDGQRVHHLSVIPWLGGDMSLLEAQGWTHLKVDYTLTTLTVADSGAPIQMSFSGGISGRYHDVGASAAFEITYDFTKIGQAVDIPPPT